LPEFRIICRLVPSQAGATAAGATAFLLDVVGYYL
jgi:hypothetical protein